MGDEVFPKLSMKTGGKWCIHTYHPAMAFPYENLQDEFFYGIMWPKSITESLITVLQTQKQLGNWVWNSHNGVAIIEAREYLNSTFHTDYTDVEVLGPVQKLRSRYGLFSQMISQSGVVWNMEQNFIYASPNQWASWRESLHDSGRTSLQRAKRTICAQRSTARRSQR
ncbi:hypothetical protein ACS0TY_033262 [Phlomoides rotata]